MTTDNKRAAFEAWLAKEWPMLIIDYAPLNKFYKGDDGKQIGDMWDAWQAALSARANSGSDARDAEPIYQCMATDDDGNGRNSENLWMDVTKTAYEKMSLRDDVRCRIVFAAIAKGDSK